VPPELLRNCTIPKAALEKLFGWGRTLCILAPNLASYLGQLSQLDASYRAELSWQGNECGPVLRVARVAPPKPQLWHDPLAAPAHGRTVRAASPVKRPKSRWGDGAAGPDTGSSLFAHSVRVPVCPWAQQGPTRRPDCLLIVYWCASGCGECVRVHRYTTNLQ